MRSRMPSSARAAAFGLIALIISAGAILAAATVSPALAAPAPELRRYPYLTDLVGANVTVNWATDRSQISGTLMYGAAPNCTANTAPASWITRSAITIGTVQAYQWKANVSGLAPDTAFCYRVFLGSTDLLGSDPSPTFRSQVAPGNTTPYSFAVFGDWGQVDSAGANSNQANLMQRIAESGVRFAVTSGDTAYPGGSQLNYGDLQQTGPDTSAIFGPSFWTVAGDTVPLFNATGNHGFNVTGLTVWPQDRTVASSSGRYQSETYCCTNGTNAGTYPSAWYAFDAGTARFYVLTAAWSDSNNGTANPYKNDYDNHWTPSSAEYQWLQNDLEAHPGGVKFAFWHYPLYSDNPNEAPSTYLRGATSLEGLLASHDVSIAFNGHAHMYQRNLKPSGGILTYLTGGGGAKLSPIGPCTSIDAYGLGWTNTSSTGSSCGAAPRPTSISQVYHFLKVTVNGQSVTVAPTDSLGRTFDVQTYSFAPGGDAEPPSAPTGLSAVAAASNRVDLSWTAATDNVAVTAYDVYRDGSLLASLGNQTGYADTSVSGATTYSYTVRARDSEGNTSPPSTAATVTTTAGDPTLTFAASDDTYVQASSPTVTAGNATTLQVDNSPVKNILLKFNVSGLVGKQVTGARLRLHDTDPSPNGGAFFQTVTSSWSEGTATWDNAPATSGSAVASLGPVSAGTWYEVDLSSVVTGDGAVSLRITSPSSDGANYASSEGTTGLGPQLIVSYLASGDTARPTAPSGLAATSPSAGRIDLTWNASSDNVGVTAYDVYRDGGPSPLASVAGTVTTYADTSVASGTTDTYVVRARDAASNVSDQSNTASGTSRPAAPGNLQATPGDGQVTLSWNGAIGASSYNVKRSTTTGGPYTTISAPGAVTGLTYTDATAENDTTYHYVVSAVNAGGESGNSNQASAQPAPPPDPPDAPPVPAGLSAAGGDSQVTLGWSASAGAASYNVKRSTTSGGPYVTVSASGTVTGTSYTDTGVVNGTTYHYVVSAVNAAGESANSNQASATPVGSTRTFVFSDGFESGNLSSWTSSGGLTVQSARTHSGTWAARGNTTNGGTYAKKTLSSAASTAYLRTYFYLASGYAHQVNVLRYRTAADVSLGYLFVNTAGKLALRNDAGAVTTISATSVGTDAWHDLELRVTVNGTSSSTEVWLDGVRINDLSLTGQDWGTSPIGRIQIGEVQTGRAYDLTLDDVAFDTARIGMAP